MYTFDSDDIIDYIFAIDDELDKVVLVGHNPAITEFANAMTGEAFENIPTCGLVQMELAIDDWADASLGSARLIEFDFPKKQS